VSEHYIVSIVHGATIKVNIVKLNLQRLILIQIIIENSISTSPLGLFYTDKTANAV